MTDEFVRELEDAKVLTKPVPLANYFRELLRKVREGHSGIPKESLLYEAAYMKLNKYGSFRIPVAEVDSVDRKKFFHATSLTAALLICEPKMPTKIIT